MRKDYNDQKSRALNRGIDFELSFEDWLTLWTESGKLDSRGRGVGKFCMGRIDSNRGYTLSNSIIEPFCKNSSRTMAEGRALAMNKNIDYAARSKKANSKENLMRKSDLMKVLKRGNTNNLGREWFTEISTGKSYLMENGDERKKQENFRKGRV